ncbi:ATPase [Burkholderia paludis]|uniref:ATPase n=1 Tax=Burkholderia paludis TaxID=1506587 RepID=A0A6P2NL23_9BURK|nr:ATPase [Burkholderia paludis]
MTASVPCVPGATFVIWRCCVSLPTDTTFERPPSFEFAPIATEFEPAVTFGTSLPVPFMSAAIPLLFAERMVLLLIVVDNWFTVVLMFDTPLDSEATLLLVELRPVDSELMPVEVDVDSEATLLFVVLRPVDSEPTPVDNELIAVEVEVDSEATLLLVAFRLVDSELMPVDSDEKFAAVDVDRLFTA